MNMLAGIDIGGTKCAVAVGGFHADGMAGLGAEWITYITPAQWAVLQVFLVVTGLLAGWSTLRYAGLLQQGVGRSRFLSEGAFSAARGFVQGSLIGLPWAFGLVVMGGSIG